MKIAYIAMQFPVPSETFASLDIQSLRRQGHELKVYGLRFKHRRFKNLMSERKLQDLYVKNFSIYSMFGSLSFSLRHPVMTASLFWWIFSCCLKSPVHLVKSLVLVPSVISIFEQLINDRPEVVHLFWGHYPSMVGYLAKRFLPDAVVSQFLGAHDMMSAYPGSICFSKYADIVFTHSRSNLAKLRAMGVDVSNVAVVARGTSVDFPIESELEKFNEPYSPLLLSAGRLINEKGFEEVLLIFSRILESRPDAQLLIAGEGPDEDYLKDRACALGCGLNTTFLGHIEQVRLIELMARSHFFLFMSCYPSERLPNVVKEAMFQQCVVVTTDTDGIGELVRNHVNGFVVEKGDWLAGVSCVISCLDDSTTAKNIAHNAMLTIKEKFDVNASMRSYRDLWEGEIERRKVL